MKPRASLTTIVIVVLLLGSIWSCDRQTAASPATAPQLPPNITIIRQDSQQAAGVAIAKVIARPLPLTTTAAGSLTVDEEKTEHIGGVFPGIVTQVIVNVRDQV